MPHIGDYIGPANVSGTVVGGSSLPVELLPANSSRTKIVLSNSGATEAWLVRLGGDATLTDYTYRIAPSGNLVLEAPIHTGSVSGVQAAADGAIMVTEFGRPELLY